MSPEPRTRSIGSLARCALVLPVLCAACATAPPAPGGSEHAVFFPAPPEPPRIQFLTSFNNSSAVQPVQDVFQQFVLGQDTREIFGIVKPYGVGMYGGTIYVCDTILGIVHVFDTVREAYSRIGEEGQGKLKKPINILITADGTKYVSDVGRGQVVVFDRQDTYLRAIGTPDECRPTGCTVVGDELFLVDVRDHEVERRDVMTGRLLGRFGGPGSALGQLFKPTNITRDAEGRIYVTDTINCRIQIFDREGNVLDSFGEVGDLPGQFARPKGIAVDDEGLIYVVDAAFENVQIFGQDTRLRLYFGGPGGAPGQMLLPAGISISREGGEYFQKYVAPDFVPEYLILVANQYGNRRVSIYAKGHARTADDE